MNNPAHPTKYFLVTLALGTNVTFRLGHIIRTVKELSGDVQLLRTAPLYQADAMLKANAPNAWNRPFYNTVVMGLTRLPPQQLLKRIKYIETRLGRSPFHALWSPRTMDIDIISYNQMRLRSRKLILPHPHTESRDFVLLPLADILPSCKLASNTASTARQQLQQAIADTRTKSYSARKTLLSYR